MNNNKKTVIVFFLFAIGITSYFAFLILKNHILTQEMGVLRGALFRLHDRDGHVLHLQLLRKGVDRKPQPRCSERRQIQSHTSSGA